ncbi:hypothetical protein [Sulfoacidibacillus thermotolerans]|nr:hypothetical protein [Sulfoacidibacillus thermotolerans]
MSFFRELERLAQGIGNEFDPQRQGNYGQQGMGAYPPQGQGMNGYVQQQGMNPYPQQGIPNPQPQMPDHICHACHVPMNYHGAHALRTGGLSRGFGLAADFLLGGQDEELINTAMEKNVVLHVFVCQNCGRVEFINDPRKGF